MFPDIPVCQESQASQTKISMTRAGTSVVTGKLNVKKSARWEILSDILGYPSEEHKLTFTETNKTIVCPEFFTTLTPIS